jgi:hypothetical protein
MNEFERVRNLELENYLLRLRLAFEEGGREALFRKAAEEWIVQYNTLHWLSRNLDKGAPMEAIAPLPVYPVETKEEYQALISSDEWVVHDNPELCIVSYRIAIRYGINPQDYTIYGGYDHFPGSAEEAVKEIQPCVDAVIRRGPLPREVIRVGLVGLTDEQLHKALYLLAPFYFDSERSRLYDQKFDQIFEKHIWPNVKIYQPQKSISLDEFSRTARKTFQNLPKKGRGVFILRERRRGRKPKLGKNTT